MIAAAPKMKCPASVGALPGIGSINPLEGNLMNGKNFSTATAGPATEQDRYLANRDKFECYFAEWLSNRAIIEAGKDDAAMDAADDRDAELARLITTMPAPHVGALFNKIEVLKRYLDDSNYTDNRPIVLFAGIEADLRRLHISERSA